MRFLWRREENERGSWKMELTFTNYLLLAGSLLGAVHTLFHLTPPHGPYKESIIIILNLLVLKKMKK